MTEKEETRELTLRQRKGRAINAVAELLRRKLSVPNIYLEPPSSLLSADILAVDRGGAGDLHAVEIKLSRDLNPFEGRRVDPSDQIQYDHVLAEHHSQYVRKLQETQQQAMSIPAHYRYLAIPAESFGLAIGELMRFGLWPEDGIGRLGVISIKDRGEESPMAEIEVVPERFRVDPVKLKTIETKLLSKSRPDIEVRI